MYLVIRCIMLGVFLASVALGQDERKDEITRIMRATYRIEGFDGSMGTVLMVGCLLGQKVYVPALITARHVLDTIKTDSARLLLR